MAKAKKRAQSTAELFKRSEAEWMRLQGHDRGAAFMAAVPAAGIACLIRYGALTAAEANMIRAVVDGSEEHPDLTADRARRLAAELDAQ
ncbi:hypothetical protein ACFYPZ_19520 [Streptomyces sp. NPDC005506]|uniref:hypothetical protein n=1 Tax=Streptomyces sp. NPDC005506 TaxID=3364718 RepID=UPI00367643CB